MKRKLDLTNQANKQHVVSGSTKRNTNKKQTEETLLNIPLDIITNEIFTFFPCQWLFRVAFLVCKCWYNSVNSFNKLIIETNLNVDSRKNRSFLLCCEEGRFNSSREFRVKGFDFSYFQQSIPIVKFTALQVLDLSYCKLGDEGMIILSQNNSSQLAGLRKFSYRYNLLTHQGVETLCSLPLAKLQVLDLSFNRVGDIGCCAFARSAFLNSLEQLELYDNKIGNNGLETLIAVNFQSIRSINLRFNVINRIDCDMMNQKLPANLPNIQTINLLFNKFESGEIIHLNESVKKIVIS